MVSLAPTDAPSNSSRNRRVPGTRHRVADGASIAKYRHTVINMPRLIFAWMLLLLAASPFTAPYATCDLATLLGHGTHGPQTVTSEEGSIVTPCDAASVSPLKLRIDLTGPVPTPALSQVWSETIPAAYSLRLPVFSLPTQSGVLRI